MLNNYLFETVSTKEKPNFIETQKHLNNHKPYGNANLIANSKDTLATPIIISAVSATIFDGNFAAHRKCGNYYFHHAVAKFYAKPAKTIK